MTPSWIEGVVGEAWTESARLKIEKTCTAKDRFNQRFPHLRIGFYTRLTKAILDQVHPRTCPNCKTQMKGGISTRENTVRCLKCNYQTSRTAYTFLHHYKLPLWTFSYLLVEQIQRFPQVLSSAEIQRKLSCSVNTAILLKRRLQIFLGDLTPAIKAFMAEEIEKEWGNTVLPESGDLRPHIAQKPVVSMDGLVLFSASQRANGGRARWKHGGTASAYLTHAVAEERGKFQIGTLCNTIAVKGGAVVLDAVPGFGQKYVKPLLDFLSADAPIMSDEGYPWLSRYNVNHRAVNHSARAKDKKRNVWARRRWCTADGTHNNVAEGVQRVVKHSFIAGYSYTTPEYSGMYLREFAGLKGVRVYGLGSLIRKASALGNVRGREF